MVGNVPPDKGCKVLDGELTHEEWNENDSENFADSGHYKILCEVKIFKTCNMTPPPLHLRKKE